MKKQTIDVGVLIALLGDLAREMEMGRLRGADPTVVKSMEGALSQLRMVVGLVREAQEEQG